MNFRNLREFRRSLGKTQTDMAEVLGESQATYSKWENSAIPEGKLPRLTALGYDGPAAQVDREQKIPVTRGDLDRLEGWLEAQFQEMRRGQAAQMTVLRLLAEEAGLGEKFRARLQVPDQESN